MAERGGKWHVWSTYFMSVSDRILRNIPQQTQPDKSDVPYKSTKTVAGRERKRENEWFWKKMDETFQFYFF